MLATAAFQTLAEGKQLGWDVRSVSTSRVSGNIHQGGQFFIVSSIWRKWITLARLEVLVTSRGHQKIEETLSIVAEIDSLLEQLQELEVNLGKQHEIREYLLQFPDLIDVIPTAVKAALNHLPEAHLFLKVYHDPEIKDQYLALYVRVQKYDESIVERIEAAEKEYLELLTDKEGWFQLTTDFQEVESL